MDNDHGIGKDDPGIRKDDPGVRKDDPGVRKDDPGVRKDDLGIRKGDPGAGRDEPGIGERAKAFILDMNGTMVDDMEYHTKAWYQVLNEELKAHLTWEQVKKEMYGKNGELLVRVFGAGHFTQEEIEKYSREKEKIYRRTFTPHLKLISGLDDMLEKARKQKVKLAIGTAAIPENVDLVLDGLHIRDYFDVVVSAADVTISKPDPATFLLCAERLGLEAKDCIVFEDAPKGVEAALNGGMKAVALTTMHTPDEFEGLPNILAFIKDYKDPWLNSLFN